MILMQHICAYKLTTTYKMTLMYFLVNIHINFQSTLDKVNGVQVLKFPLILYIYEVIVKKICINYKIYLRTLNFFTICVNHNEQHNGG
jgi:hypothetical protein